MVDRYNEETMLGYIEGDLTPDQAAQFEASMTKDPRLKSLVSQLVQDRRTMRTLPTESPPDELLSQVTQRLERSMLLDAPPPELSPVRPSGSYRLGRMIAYSGLAAMILISAAVVVHTLVDRNLYEDFTPAGLSMSRMADNKPRRSNSDQLFEFKPNAPTTPSISSTLADDEHQNAEQALALSDASTAPMALLENRSDTAPPPKQDLLEIINQSGLRVRGDANTEATGSFAMGHKEGSLERRAQVPQTPDAPASADTFARLTPAPAKKMNTAKDQPLSPLAQKVMQHLTQADPQLASSEAKTEDEALTAARQLGKAKESDAAQTPAESPASPTARPTVWLELATHDPQTGQQALLTWTVANAVPIVALTTPPQPDAAQLETTTDADRNPSSAQPRQITLAMTASQLTQLLRNLNTAPNQHARLLPQAPSWNAPSITWLVQAAPPYFRTDDDADTAAVHPPRIPLVGHGHATAVQPLFKTDWGQLLMQRIPMRPTVPVYDPQTQLTVTVLVLPTPNADSESTETPND